MSDKTSVSYNGGVGLIGLIILFWNFDDNTFDLYDKIVQFLGSFN